MGGCSDQFTTLQSIFSIESTRNGVRRVSPVSPWLVTGSMLGTDNKWPVAMRIYEGSRQRAKAVMAAVHCRVFRRQWKMKFTI